MSICTFTLQNPIVFEIDPSKKKVGVEGKNVRGQHFEKIGKVRMGYTIKGNFNLNLNLVFKFWKFQIFSVC